MTGKKQKNKGGRPSKVTPEVLVKLEHAFMKSFTDEQACLYAEISPDALYNYCTKYPEFSEKKRVLKGSLALKAKLNIAGSIEEGEISSSKWWLERKNKAEFSLRVENTGKDGKDLIPDKIIRDDIKGDKE
jgi:hypothetical protein